jgi:5-hydroxyisourate hydrolase-like protein (transthyretin family)
MKLVAALLAPLPLLAAVDGVVINRTSGKPQASVTVNLVQPGEKGMQTLGTATSDAAGKFAIDKEFARNGPTLIQAQYKDVTYTKLIPPNMPTTGVEVEIFDASSKPGIAKTAEHMILLEPSAESLTVNETFLCQNQSNLTFADPENGSLQFFLPEAAGGKVRVTISAPGGMPIQRPAEKVGRSGLYKVSYPLKPGETRFDIVYAVPATSSFASKSADPSTATRLVTPSSVTLTGEGLDSLGQEPQTQAHIYSVKNAKFEVKIEGTGSLRNPDTAAQEEDNGQPQVLAQPARVYSKAAWVIGLTLAILGLGGVMLYRRGAA